MLQEHIRDMRSYEGIAQDEPLTLKDVRLALKWSASGVGEGEDYSSYLDIPIDEEYAQKLFDGYILVVDSGIMEYVKGE